MRAVSLTRIMLTVHSTVGFCPRVISANPVADTEQKFDGMVGVSSPATTQATTAKTA